MHVHQHSVLNSFLHGLAAALQGLEESGGGGHHARGIALAGRYILPEKDARQRSWAAKGRGRAHNLADERRGDTAVRIANPAEHLMNILFRKAAQHGGP